MGDMGDMYKEMRKERQAKHGRGFRRNMGILIESGLPFVVINDTCPRFTEDDGTRIDFWPHTGRWRIVGQKSKTMSGGAESFLNWLRKRGKKIEVQHG